MRRHIKRFVFDFKRRAEKLIIINESLWSEPEVGGAAGFWIDCSEARLIQKGAGSY